MKLASPSIFCCFSIVKDGFGGDFDGDFVGGLGAGAFVAFDRGFVGVGADARARGCR